MPRVRDTSTAADSTDTTSHSIVVPNTQSGDLLLWFVVKDTTAGDGPNPPAGWNTYYTRVKYARFAVFWRRSDGTESGTTVTTTSSDADAWVSVMASLVGASDPDSVSTVSEFLFSTAGHEFVVPATTLPGSNRMALWFAWTNATPAATGGPGGVMLGALDATSIGLLVHADNFFNESQTYPFGLQASASVTFAGAVMFVPDDGTGWHARVNNGWVERAINYLAWDDGFIDDASTDTYTIPVTSIAGRTAQAAPASNTNYQVDAGIYPMQKGWRTAAPKGANWRATYGALSRKSEAPADLSQPGTFLLYGLYPQEPRRFLQLGPVDFGAGLGLIDTNGNMAFWPTNGADDVTYLSAGFLSLLLDPYYQSGALQYDAGFDPANIDKFLFAAHSANGNAYTIASRLFIVSSPQIVGGSTTHTVGISELIRWFSGSYHRPYRTIGGLFELRIPFDIGDGSIETHFQMSGQSLLFPRSGSVSLRDVTHQVAPGKMGINLNLTSTSTASFTSSSISCPSGFYIKHSGAGSATIDGCNLGHPILVEAKSGFAFTNSNIEGGHNIHVYSGSTFSGNRFSGRLNSADPTVILHDVSSLSDTTVDGAYIAIRLTDPTITNYTFDGVVLSNNDYDIENTSGVNVTIAMVGGSVADQAKLLETSGSITLDYQATVTVTGFVSGSRILVQNVDSGTILYNDIPASDPLVVNFSLGGNPSANILVRVRNASGYPRYKPWEQSAVVDSTGATFRVTQTIDE